MHLHSDWGALHFIVFLTEAEIEGVFLTEAIEENIEVGDPVQVHTCINEAELRQTIERLDTADFKVVKFHAHGSSQCPGTLFNALFNYDLCDLIPVLGNMRNREFTTLDFTGVCNQGGFTLPGFRHLLTTSQLVPMSVSTQNIIHSFNIYSQPINENTAQLAKGRLGLYRWHY